LEQIFENRQLSFSPQLHLELQSRQRLEHIAHSSADDNLFADLLGNNQQ
jgi:hypothetical protein